MDYKREQRWTNYNDVKCKEYARHDFKYQCAYCLMNERETGLSYSAYEIDHFIPVVKEELYNGNVNEYNNLFYSCQKCNRKKADFVDEDLLNPCIDDVYFGENPAVYIDDDYKVIANNTKGEVFIDVFKLNSRYHINRRRNSFLSDKNNMMISNLLDDIIILANDEIKENLNQVKKIMENQSVHSYELTDRFDDVNKTLETLNLRHKFIFEANNIDLFIELDGTEYFCELIFDKTKENKNTYEKRIKKEKLQLWFNDDRNIGVLFFFHNLNKLYFVPLSKIVENQTDLKDINLETSVFIDDSNLITKYNL